MKKCLHYHLHITALAVYVAAEATPLDDDSTISEPRSG